MSGSYAIKGFLVQTIVCVLDALKDDQWDSFSMEPDLETEKVDILWRYKNSIKAVQVKSSKNQIREKNVRQWAADLENSIKAENYSLILVGHCAQSVIDTEKLGKVLIPRPLLDNEETLLEQAAFKLDEFSERQQIQINATQKVDIINTLISNLLLNSVNSREITRNEFENDILRMLKNLTSANSKKNTNIKPLDKAYLFIRNLEEWVSASELEFYNENSPEYKLTVENIDWHLDFFEHWMDRDHPCLLTNSEIKLTFNTTVLKVFRAINLEERCFFPVPKYYDPKNVNENGKGFIVKDEIESFVCAVISGINSLENYYEEISLNFAIYGLKIDLKKIEEIIGDNP